MSEPLNAAVLRSCLLPVCMAAVHFAACLHDVGTCRLVSHLPLLPCHPVWLQAHASGDCSFTRLSVTWLCCPGPCRETRQWMLGTSDGRMPDFLGGRSAVVWAREYSTEDAHKCDCNALRTALSMIPGAKRMVGGACGMHACLH